MNLEETKLSSNVTKGISASSGIVIGKAYVLDRHYFCVLEQLLEPDEINDEVERFRSAVEASLNEMGETREQATEELNSDLPFTIFDSHMRILQDPTMIKEIEGYIVNNKCNAEWALKLLLESYHERFSKIKDGYFRDRLLDIEQVVTKIQRQLIQDEINVNFSTLAEPVILVTHDLTPEDTMMIDTAKIIGIASDVGGKTSHAGIMAASMDIPAVVGLKDLSFKARTGSPIIVDGNSGKAILNPTKEQFIKYNKKRQKFIYEDQAFHANRHLAATTLDGHTIKILANIESSHDILSLNQHGAEGVGLYRTEYLYLNRRSLPSEEEQFEDYKKVAESVDKNHAVIRTFDLGGDKLSSLSDQHDHEQNPALGLRAIRFSLGNKDLFKTQLRAILRASAFGKLKIMYPLITLSEEVTEANAVLTEVKEELTASKIDFDESIEVGIMMETPAAAMIANELSKYCSFFSIGTNDMIQYLMAIDRVNERVAYLYQPLSPSILRILAQIIKSADENNVSISVCGKMAGDPTYAMLLIGLGGVRELSMDVHSIPMIKAFIRSIRITEANEIATDALKLGSAKEIREFMVGKIGKFLVNGISSDLVENDTE